MYDNDTEHSTYCPGIVLVWNSRRFYTSICLSFDDGLHTTTRIINWLLIVASVVEHTNHRA